MTAVDEVSSSRWATRRSALVSGGWYSAQIETPINSASSRHNSEYKVDPGYYAAGTYLCGAVLDAALKALSGKVEDKNAFIKALRASDRSRPRGPVRFDEYGNVVGNIYIRKVERKGGKLVNTDIKTYPERQPVLDLQPEGVPEASGVQSRELAGWQKSRAVTRARSPRATRASILRQPQKSITMPSRGRKTMTVNRRSVIEGRSPPAWRRRCSRCPPRRRRRGQFASVS